jgi:hypothetical protein
MISTHLGSGVEQEPGKILTQAGSLETTRLDSTGFAV